MSIDGFGEHDGDAFVAYDEGTAKKAAAWIARLGDRLHAEIEGIDRLPSGRALLVANHAFGWDVGIAMSLVERKTSREVFALGEHAWWKFPVLRRVAAAIGVVDGTQTNVDRLLQAEHLVVVLPGGLREAVKPRELRYRMLWGNRYGFVRAAIRNHAPLVPLACLGADDVFDFVGDAYRRGARIFRHAHIPLPRPAHLWSLPHRAHLKYVIGEPIATEGLDECDDKSVRRLRREIEGALHEIIEEELARRLGVES